jgi:hypothetical protein
MTWWLVGLSAVTILTLMVLMILLERFVWRTLLKVKISGLTKEGLDTRFDLK